MTDEERRALASLKFNYTQVADDVWRPPQFHIENLHRHTAQMVLDGLAEAKGSRDASPIGVVVQGQRGTGKTHLLGWAREQVHLQGGYFFLVSLLDAKGFWDSILVSMLDSLSREVDGASQLKIFLRNLSRVVGVPLMVRRAVVGDTRLTRETLDIFIEALRRFDRLVGRDSQDTARALILRVSDDLNAQDVGDNFLASELEEVPGERARWGIRHGTRTAQEVVKDLSRLLALTGPSVIAVDQIDALIAQASFSTVSDTGQDWREKLLIERIAGGLMSLREVSRRTLTLVCCIPSTWILVKSIATDTVRDRFREAVQLKRIPDANTGRALVEKRFMARFGEIGFDPPYRTWPVKPSAFEQVYQFTPRQLLIKIDGHIRTCLVNDEITELEHLSDPITDPVPVKSMVSSVELAALDARFMELHVKVDIGTALDSRTEDAVMPGLLSAGLAAWIREQDETGLQFSQDAPPSSKPPLHARLRRTLNEDTEDEEHWCFRAISTKNANAALNRLRAACVAAGLDVEVPKRRLFVLRTSTWSLGPRTREAVAAFEQAGGRTLQVDEEDLKVLSALRSLLEENSPGLQGWLLARRPTEAIKILKQALGDTSGLGAQAQGDGATLNQWLSARNTGKGLAAPPGRAVADSPFVEAPDGAWIARGKRIDPLVPQMRSPATTAVANHMPSITLGERMSDGRPVSVELEALRKHTAIFAGSGSGKTVLIRRLIEECALQGVSTIVLDPNNDLARLGDRWPEEPPPWAPGDAAKAEEYLANTDVVVWTPRRDGGRPLSFQPLPDFGSVVGDADEFAEAVESAVASIAPRVKLVGNTPKAHQGLAVLREAVTHYGRHGGSSLKGLIALLAELPEGVSELRNAEKLAAEIAENLTAATVNDPLFGGGGVPVDPGILLTPPVGKRARVSVISLVGLQSDDQRQSFVNQLQMALFAWIKKHPAGGRPLGGLFVMDEAQTFAPSGAMTACTQSTLALASQARKYGLGLVFATQAPKGLHNRIPGNAATQFFGLLNSSIQITAAKELARAKGSDVSDIARLGSGQFYAAVEGAGFEKLRTPLCLSHHPRSPLTTEEVIDRARGDL